MTRPLHLAVVLALAAACRGCPPQGDLTITTESLPPGNVDATYSAAVVAEGGAPPVTFDVASGALPLGVALDAFTGELRGSPTEYGVFQFGVRATDSAGVVAVKGLSIEVFPYPPVRIVTTEVRNAVVGGSYLAILSALDGSPPYTWSLASGALPQGLRLTEGGSLLGSATALESQTFEVRARDRRQEALARLTITTFLPLAFAPAGPSLPDAYEGEAYSLAFTGSGGKAPYSFLSALAGGLPPWLTLSGAGVLSGTAPVSSAGPYALSIRILDDSRTEQVAIQDYTLAVLARPALAGAALADGYVGEAYQATLPAATGGRAPFTYAVSAGALPAGLTLSAAGALTGTPIAEGTGFFTVTATDANGREASALCSLAVYPPPVIATTSLPDAVRGQPYSAGLLSSGGKPTVEWTVTPGALPTGLSLSGAAGSTGTISGTPSGTGFYSFAATVTDPNGRFDTADLSILVSAPAPDGGSDGGMDAGMDGGTDGGFFDGRFFRLANWNVEWFGDPNNGPTNEPLQQANVRAIMADAGYEIWALQEVVDVPAFNALVAGLPGYEGVIASDSARVAGTNSCGAGGTLLCYSSGEQKLALVYRADVVRLVSARLILTTNDDSFAFRPPMRVDFALDGGTERLTVITLHMKAAATINDWNRRQDAGGLVESYLRTSFDGGSRVAVIGDWNDDVDFSIVGGQPTPYANFNADPATFTFLTAPMSAAGIGSTISFSSFIDHQLVLSGLSPWYRSGSAQRVPFTTWVPGAGTSTSDHYPIVSRFDLGNPPDGG